MESFCGPLESLEGVPRQLSVRKGSAEKVGDDTGAELSVTQSGNEQGL